MAFAPTLAHFIFAPAALTPFVTAPSPIVTVILAAIYPELDTTWIDVETVGSDRGRNCRDQAARRRQS
jgi:hypothetical protein